VKQVIGERRDVDLRGHAGLREQGLDRGGDEQLLPDVGGEERVDAERVTDAEADVRARIEKDEPECAPERREDRLAGVEIRMQQQLGFGPVDPGLEAGRGGEVGTVVEDPAEDCAGGTCFGDLRVRGLEELQRRAPEASNPARVHGVW
jgi:hypothetical protein